MKTCGLDTKDEVLVLSMLIVYEQAQADYIKNTLLKGEANENSIQY